MYEWKIPIRIQHSESRSYIQWQIPTINLLAIQYIYVCVCQIMSLLHQTLLIIVAKLTTS